MMTYFHVYDDFNKSKGIKNDLNRFVMDHFCELIDNN